MLRVLASMFLVLALSYAAAAKPVGEPLPMDQAFRISVAQGSGGATIVRWEIADGYYLYRDYLHAEQAGKEVELQTEKGEVKDDPNFGRTEIYHQRAQAVIPGSVTGEVSVTYQGCQQDGLCYPPKTRTIDTAGPSLVAEAAEAGGGSEGGFAFAEAPDNGSAARAEAPPKQDFQVADDDGGIVSGLMARGGTAMVLLGFLGFGFLLAFTPCVFPMYPILAGMLAREGDGLSMRRGFVLSLSYVLALATAFGLLGVAAAWSGRNLQVALQSTTAVIVVSVIFVALALSMFGLYDLQLPAALTRRVSRMRTSGRVSIGNAAALGFTSALVVSPCVTAPLAGALLYIARSADIALGAAALFALGLGKGIPLITMGTLGSHVMPKAGAWMETVKQAFGFIFLATAIYLAEGVLPEGAGLALWAVLAAAAGVFLGAFDPVAGAGAGRRVAKTAGIVALFYAAALGTGALAGSSDPVRPLSGLFAGNGPADQAKELSFAQAGSRDDLQAILGDGKPAMVYFTADWCVTCRTIDRRVLPDARTRQALDGLDLVEVDLTDVSGAKKELMQEMGVAGPPTMIFFDGKAREAKGTRLVGDFGVGDLTASAHAVQ